MNLQALILLLFTLGVTLACSETVRKDEIVKNAQKIDALIQAKLANQGGVPSAPVKDHTFVRRAFLTIIGRIPTYEELQRFQQSSSPQMRGDLIDELYDHAGYGSHLSNWAMDLFRLRDKTSKRENAQVFLHWVRDSLSQNMPWDEFAHTLVTSKGNAWTDSGAAGYYAMDPGMQNDNLSNTAFAFLGVKLECAQCHDDPFQEWERMDFYQLSALVNGRTGVGNKSQGPLRKLAAERPELYAVEGFPRIDKFEQAIRYYANFGVPEAKGSGVVKLPNDWQYDDADPGSLVKAKTPFGQRYKSKAPLPSDVTSPDFSKLKGLPKEERKSELMRLRAQKKKLQAAYKGPGDGLIVFGDWLVSDDTPQFSQTIALRMWDRVMGFSLTETLGVYEDPEDSEYPELLSFLSELMKSYQYDVKAFQRTLAHTRAFQYEIASSPFTDGGLKALYGRRLERMSAEQIWDSLLSLTVKAPDSLPKRQLPQHVFAGKHYVGPISEIVKEANSFKKRADYTDYIKIMYKKLIEGELGKAPVKLSSSQDGERGVMEMAGELPKQQRKAIQKDYRKSKNHLKRASEVRSPVPQDHFLATFGVSDRLTIDSSTQEGAVSQALAMYNGVVQRYIVYNRSSALNIKLKTLTNPEEKIKMIFMSTLSRPPSEDELSACLIEVVETGERAYANIISALISSQEFLFMT